MKTNLLNRMLLLSTTAMAAFVLMACNTAPAADNSSEPAAVSQPTATTAPAEPTAAPEATAETAPAEATPTPEASAEAESPAPIANTKINLNDMSADALLNTIPNFSQRFVREFFEYQPYISIQQFRREMAKYVDESQITAWEAYVYVPVNVDESDAATIMQIPGVDENMANALIDARPFGSNDAFLQKLTELSSAEVAATAAGYLAQ